MCMSCVSASYSVWACVYLRYIRMVKHIMASVIRCTNAALRAVLSSQTTTLQSGAIAHEALATLAVNTQRQS